jgi:hypothetical protein
MLVMGAPGSHTLHFSIQSSSSSVDSLSVATDLILITKQRKQGEFIQTNAKLNILYY